MSQDGSDMEPMNREAMKKAYTKEVRKMKLCSATCMGFGLVIASTFASMYWSLLQHSSSYNAEQYEI